MGLTLNAVEAEREELAWLLSSGVLGRSNNLARMLTFICEMHFEGREDHIKEHTIAVEALGRRPDFDPHVDTIVRVTAHSLRKRLQEVYQNEGASRPMHIVIPAGNYVPSFIPQASRQSATHTDLSIPELELVSASAEPTKLSRRPALQPGFTHSWLMPAAVLCLIALLTGAFVLVRRHNPAQPNAVDPTALAAVPPNTTRALPGDGRKPYVDHSGNLWLPSSACTGGSSVKVPNQKIIGTEDPYLYMGGIRGIAHCIFPVKPGLYELHFHFAETTDTPPATRVTAISVNAGPNIGFDVVDDAGGDGIATSFVLTGIPQENDGAIHVDYMSEVSLLNAIEILPAPSEALLPVRIVAASSPYTDAAGQVWLSDRYFSGGRRGQLARTGPPAGLGMYRYDRVGRFRYTIPVYPGEKYRVSLYFREPWFGKHNGAIGGPGSRVFDVYCNGNALLKNFDILAEGGADPVVKTFHNIQPTALGKIELSFTSVMNYPVINAIEVVPEP
jgi:Malectin domain